jgi:hypothetical protein
VLSLISILYTYVYIYICVCVCVCVYEGEGIGGINQPTGDASNDNYKTNYQNSKNYQTVYYFKMKYLQN